MTDWKRGLHPDLIKKVERVLSYMEEFGHPMRVCQGLRTTEEQQKLYAQGRTAPGKIVTKADGVRKKSNHQAKEDGFGYAVDCCFTTGEPFGEHQPWVEYGKACRLNGLEWGGDWKSIVDRPHAEMI